MSGLIFREAGSTCRPVSLRRRLPLPLTVNNQGIVEAGEISASCLVVQSYRLA